MSCTLRILPDGPVLSARAGQTLLDALRAGGVCPDTPCGGNGICGKCAVEILSGMPQGRALACQITVQGDLAFSLPVDANWRFSHACAAEAPEHAPQRPDASMRAGKPLLAAVDIGTTSLVCLLLDAAGGDVLATVSAANPQAQYGADVISRIQFAENGGQNALREAVLSGVNALLLAAARAANAKCEDIARCVLVGNSCMQHLFFGLPCASLGRAPYMPAVRGTVRENARKAGLHLQPDAELVFLPLIAGFVGADTVGALLAADFDRIDAPTLLLDIGTNGELAVTNGTQRFACSTAAGPAFEGARIRFGMRGEKGAIDHLRLENGALSYTVIGGGKPRGLCGSALLDAAAVLLQAGVLEESGRMRSASEAAALRLPLAARIVSFEGKPAFVLAAASESESGADILLTQQDIRELQLAKAALAAGVTLLMQKAGLGTDALKRVLLAGAFGSFLDPGSACAVGLIPGALRERTVSIGNAALAGAKIALTEPDGLRRAETLAAETIFVELASCPDFQDVFVDALVFPVPADAS